MKPAAAGATAGGGEGDVSASRKLKPFKAWLLWDAEGTYEDMLHFTRRSAEAERRENLFLRDAKWRIVRVLVTPTPASR